jgi:hypothetical protein
MSNPDTNAGGVASMRSLAPALYLMAILLVVYPLLQVSAGMDSIDPGELRWRYGAVGLLMDGSLLPLLGGLIAVATAHLLDHRRVQVTLQALGGLLLVGLAVMAAMFILDAVQLRASVRAEVIPLYDRLSLKALVMLLTDMLFVGILSYSSFLTTRRLRRAERAARRAPAHPEIRVPTPTQR